MVRCSRCGEINSTKMKYCMKCGAALRIRDSAHGASVRDGALSGISGGMKILLYIASLAIPIAGFVIGFIYYSKPDYDYKHVGKICILLAIFGAIWPTLCFMIFYAMILSF